MKERCTHVKRPKKILLAYDGSAHSKEALGWAIDLSLQSGAPLIAVKVAEPDVSHRSSAMFQEGYGVTLYERFVEMQKLDEKQLAEVLEAGHKMRIEIKTEILYGNVAATILDYAKKNDVDLIVAGTKGRGALEDLLMGGVTRNLVSLSHIPVLIVKAPEE